MTDIMLCDKRKRTMLQYDPKSAPTSSTGICTSNTNRKGLREYKNMNRDDL